MARILFCTWQYHPVAAGGAERQARLQAEELVRRGHEVTVVCPRAPGVDIGEVAGVRVVRLRRLHGRVPRRLTYFANLFRFVVQHGRSFDVVHVHLANLQADAVVAAARLRGLPTHVKVANSGAAGETRRLSRVARLTRWYGLRHADSVQALSQETAAELARIGVSPERVVPIPNGVPLPGPGEGRRRARRLLDLPEEQGIVLYAGRFARYKGLGDLVEAWRSLSCDGWSLVLVGEEAVDDPYGAVPDLPGLTVRPWARDVQTYLEAADVFVLPSRSEGMSNALLEAMASGVAVVTSDTGAAPEMVEHGRSGLVHRTGDVADLSQKLQLVMSDAALRGELAAAGRQRVQEFSVERVVDRLEDVYSRIGRSRS